MSEAPVEYAAAEPAPVEQPVAYEAPQETAVQTDAQEHEPAAASDDGEQPESRGRGKRNRNQERFDRNRDVRGPEDRARKTRRNPHGIAEMEYGDNVIAFGGFTPAFLLVDPYGGKGAPPPPAEDMDPEVQAQDSRAS